MHAFPEATAGLAVVQHMSLRIAIWGLRPSVRTSARQNRENRPCAPNNGNNSGNIANINM